ESGAAEEFRRAHDHDEDVSAAGADHHHARRAEEDRPRSRAEGHFSDSQAVRYPGREAVRAPKGSEGRGPQYSAGVRDCVAEASGEGEAGCGGRIGASDFGLSRDWQAETPAPRPVTLASIPALLR